LIDSQVGAVFMINGKVVGMDSFGKPDSFSKVFKKLVQSYALDAIDWFRPEKEYKIHKSKVTTFLRSSRSARMETCPSVGLGTDRRLESRKMSGFAFTLDDQILHICIFARENKSDREVPGSRMGRFSARRRNKR